MTPFISIYLPLHSFVMGVVRRLRDLLRPRPDQPAPAWAYAPAPTRRPALPPREPPRDDEWRPLWRSGQPERRNKRGE